MKLTLSPQLLFFCHNFVKLFLFDPVAPPDKAKQYWETLLTLQYIDRRSHTVTPTSSLREPLVLLSRKGSILEKKGRREKMRGRERRPAGHRSSEGREQEAEEGVEQSSGPSRLKYTCEQIYRRTPRCSIAGLGTRVTLCEDRCTCTVEFEHTCKSFPVMGRAWS